MGIFKIYFTQKWGGFSVIANLINPETSEIKITYQFDSSITQVSKVVNTYLDINYSIKITKVGLLDYRLFEEIFSNKGKVVLEHPDSFSNKELLLSQFKVVAEENPIFFSIKNFVERISIYNYLDTSFNGNIRQLSPYFSDENLLSDGKNLTSLLSYLNGNAVKSFDKLIKEFKKVNPNFRELVFTVPMAGKTLLSLKEKNLDRAITIEHISDGTLRYLLLLSIFYNPKRGSVVCLDEPEMGLHPDMINGIARGIKYAAENGTQMIIATHSPLLLNAFELEDLMIFEKNDTNETIVKKVSEGDFPEWEGEFLAGQMWLRGKIGGTRW